MLNREKLQEQYEESLFALLMDEVAVSEGRKALLENEQLQEDPGAEIPECVITRCQKTISKCFAHQTNKKTKYLVKRVFHQVAAVALVGMLLFSAAFAASSDFRSKILNLVIETFDVSTDFHFGAGERSVESGFTITANWLPDDYCLEEEGGDEQSTWQQYCNSSGETLKINLLNGTDTMLSVDTENSDTEVTEIQGCDAMIIYKGDTTQISWTDEARGVFVSVVANDLEAGILLKVAENIFFE